MGSRQARKGRDEMGRALGSTPLPQQGNAGQGTAGQALYRR